MSYNYWLMRARNSIREAADIDEPNLVHIGTFEEIKQLVLRAHPAFEFNDADRSCQLKDDSQDVILEIGHAEAGPSYLIIVVKAWWRERFEEQLVALATSLGLFAFDVQQNRIVGGVLDPNT